MNSITAPRTAPVHDFDQADDGDFAAESDALVDELIRQRHDGGISDETAGALIRLWTRPIPLTDDERAAIVAVVESLEPAQPVDWTPGPCPDWCDSDHTVPAQLESDSMSGSRNHSGTVVSVETDPATERHPARHATVNLWMYESADEPLGQSGSGLAYVYPEVGEEFPTTDAARRFAAGLIEAAALADAFNAKQGQMMIGRGAGC